MEEICEDFLARGDTEVFLVAITEQIDSRQSELTTPEAAADEVATFLLQEQYRSILSRLGWDLMMVFAPRLHPSFQHSWQLVQLITTVCSPREMVLALLEQMEVLSERKPLLVFLMLDLLKKVMTHMTAQRGSVVDSTLGSTFGILKPLVLSAGREGKGIRGGRKGSAGEGEPRVEGGAGKMEVEGGRCEERNKEDADIKMKEREASREAEIDCGDEDRGADGGLSVSDSGSEEGGILYEVPLQEALRLTLDFVEPFCRDVHLAYAKSNGGGWSLNVGGWGWTTRQRECIAMLLSLLDYPLVRKKLAQEGGSDRKIAGQIMSSLVLSHCDCHTLLSWTPPNTSPEAADWLSDTDSPSSLPAVGLACFAYLLLAEHLELSYLPLVYQAGYVFHISLKHCKTLLERTENNVVKKGLRLLEAVLARVTDHTLTSDLLDDAIYTNIVQVLTHQMTMSPIKSTRQTSVKMFQQLLAKFEARGRHRYYRSLFHHIHHSGVKGLLIHSIKEEVDNALKEVSSAPVPSKFLGQDLVPLLELALKVEEGMELLKEFDSLMSALNLLRYLLIRDKRELNQSGVWDMVSSLSAGFVAPLRRLLTETSSQCRDEVLRKREEMKSARQQGRNEEKEERKEEEPLLMVEVAGDGQLPEPSLLDEIEMLEVAQQQMDMMKSVLVRVEELI